MLRNDDKMKPNWTSWTASQAPDKSPSWKRRLQDMLASQALDVSASWKRKLMNKSPYQDPDISASLTGLSPERMGFPVISQDRPASWTRQSPGHVSCQDRSASPICPLRRVSLQGKTQDRTPMTNRQLTAQVQGHYMT